MSDPLKIAIAGLGTVGIGTLELLAAQSELLAMRCGRSIQVTVVSARDRSRDRGVDLSDYRWFDDPAEMATQADAEAIVELIGGSDGPALALTDAALAAGRHVVTANKALIALHGTALAETAERAGVMLAYEAAVAGAIPVVRAIREGLSANTISRLHGILNGTCNYILTTMRETGRDFDDVLADAQALGYAEADPSFDIDGIDTAHKLAILASLAFGSPVNFDSIFVQGIRSISAQDIAFADELGYRIKLLGIAETTPEGLRQRVHPAMVPFDAPMASVEGVLNAVATESNFAGPTVLEGRGAGAGPTASAVVGDLVDIACGRITPAFGLPVSQLGQGAPAPMESHIGPYYIRLMVYDKPGVFADVAAILSQHEISMEGVIQRARSETEAVPVVLTTHETGESAMMRALESIGGLASVSEPPHVIRIERF
ncbi:MAG: homoserine dehydrogenase [Methyloligellaceae bacterium]